MQNLSCAVCAVIILVLLALAPLVATQCPTESGDWLLFKDSCYKFYNDSQFWYTAEMTCQASNGHLVSIGSDYENRLVSKMSFCNDVWIGRYATDLKKLSDASSYAWTDEGKEDAAKVYSRHNFSETETIHKTLIRSMGLSWFNSLYHEQHPFMCKVRTTADHEPRCPSTMRFYKDHCYLHSGFEATFIEANFFCQNRSTHVASVLNETEMRFLNAVDLDMDACELQPTWLGLVKLNPCFPNSGGRELCYQWTDYSGKHLDFPIWAEGQPAADGEVRSEQDCVVISGERLSSAKCTERHKFVCKAPASSLTVGSPVWQALEEAPKPIDEAKDESVKHESDVSNVRSEATPVPESNYPTTPPTTTTEAPNKESSPETPTMTTEAPNEEGSPETPTMTNEAPDEEGTPETATTSVPEELASPTEAPLSSTTAPKPVGNLYRKKRAAPVKKPSHKKAPARNENEAVEERFPPWSLGKLISDILTSGGDETPHTAKRRAKPRKDSPPPPKTLPPLPTPAMISPKDLENDSPFSQH